MKDSYDDVVALNMTLVLMSTNTRRSEQVDRYYDDIWTCGEFSPFISKIELQILIEF